MKTIAKLFLILTLVFALCVVTAAASLTWSVYHSGLISVKVTERNWDNSTHRVRVMFPAAFANVAIRTLPVLKRLEAWDHNHHRWNHDDGAWADIDVNDHHWHGGTDDFEEWLPFLNAVADELERYPDMEIVEVDDGDEHVRVAMRGGALYVDVHSDREDVEVRIPARTVRLALETLSELR